MGKHKTNANGLESLDQNTLDELYRVGAFLVINGVPEGTEFGIDYGSWTVGPKFRGLKMIPPGLHFIFFSSVSKEGTVAPRVGFFHHFQSGEVSVWDYKKEVEMLVEGPEFAGTMKDIDSSLAPYPFQHYEKWCSLTGHITELTVRRVSPLCKMIHSATPLLNNPQAARDVEQAVGVEEKLDAHFVQDENSTMRFTKIQRHIYPAGATPQQITMACLDSSSRLNDLISSLSSPEEILSELQLAFIVFLLGHVYSAFEQWKQLVDVICRVREGLHQHPDFYKNFIRVLHFQLRETPEDFFVDIVSRNNFLTTTLKIFFENLVEEDGLDGELVSRGAKFQNHLTKYFSWDFSYDEEDAPVVVEME